MEDFENDFMALPDLAKALGVDNTVLRHLQDEHGLEPRRNKGQKVATLEEGRDALTECEESCGAGIEVHIDATELIPSHIPSKAELVAAAKADGLMPEAKVAKLAAKLMPGNAKPIALKKLLDLNLNPARAIEDARFYDPAEVKAATELWEELNKGRAKELAERNKKTSRQSSGSNTSTAPNAVAIFMGGVYSSHIAGRFNIDRNNASSVSNHMTWLRNGGLQKLGRDGTRIIYDPNVVDALEQHEAIQDWPEHVRLVPCATIVKFLKSKGFEIRNQRDRLAHNFLKYVVESGVPLYRDNQPRVYRVSDLEASWNQFQKTLK